MNQLYKAIGTTKQNIHQRLDCYLVMEEEKAILLPVMRQIREDHPGMGAKMMYEKLQTVCMGRDRFIDYYNEKGFKLQQTKNYRRTTDSSGVIRFPNYLEGRELTGVNQAFVSDITYYEINGRFYYLTLITDVYSRKIKGHKASKTLKTTDTTIPALKMVLKNLPPGKKPIFHSDGGGQYYCKEFLKLTEGRFINSMCECAYENPHAERLNGTIKNYYLKHWDPKDFNELTKMLDKAVDMYNNGRPHQSLGKLTPQQFEQSSIMYPQKIKILTKEKRSKKEKFNNNNNENILVNSTSKTVNLI